MAFHARDHKARSQLFGIADPPKVSKKKKAASRVTSTTSPKNLLPKFEAAQSPAPAWVGMSTPDPWEKPVDEAKQKMYLDALLPADEEMEDSTEPFPPFLPEELKPDSAGKSLADLFTGPGSNPGRSTIEEDSEEEGEEEPSDVSLSSGPDSEPQFEWFFPSPPHSPEPEAPATTIDLPRRTTSRPHGELLPDSQAEWFVRNLCGFKPPQLYQGGKVVVDEDAIEEVDYLRRYAASLGKPLPPVYPIPHDTINGCEFDLVFDGFYYRKF